MSQPLLDTALDVRRGLKRIKDLPEADQPKIRQILATVREADFAKYALAKERPLGRVATTTPMRPRASRFT